MKILIGRLGNKLIESVLILIVMLVICFVFLNFFVFGLFFKFKRRKNNLRKVRK